MFKTAHVDLNCLHIYGDTGNGWSFVKIQWLPNSSTKCQIKQNKYNYVS